MDGCYLFASNIQRECLMVHYSRSQFVVMETQISDLKDDLEKERQKSRAVQANYERQVYSDYLQSFSCLLHYLTCLHFYDSLDSHKFLLSSFLPILVM